MTSGPKTLRRDNRKPRVLLCSILDEDQDLIFAKRTSSLLTVVGYHCLPRRRVGNRPRCCASGACCALLSDPTIRTGLPSMSAVRRLMPNGWPQRHVSYSRRA
jgi:hypothetical protein